MKRLTLILIFALGLIACGGGQTTPPPILETKNVTYQGYIPKKLPLETDPKLIIEQALYDQGKFAPNDVMVNDRFFKTTVFQIKTSIWTGGMSTVPVSETVSYSSIGRIRCFEHRYGHIVDIYDKSNKRRYRMRSTSKELAHDFIDAVFTIISER